MNMEQNVSGCSDQDTLIFNLCIKQLFSLEPFIDPMSDGPHVRALFEICFLRSWKYHLTQNSYSNILNSSRRIYKVTYSNIQFLHG